MLEINQKIIRLNKFIFDEIFPHIRYFFWPFKIFSTLWDASRLVFWLLSNEYTKTQMGKCGNGVRINGRLKLTAPKKLFIEDNVHINDNAYLRCEGGLRIGRNTHISRNLVVYTMNHQYEGSLLPYDNEKILKPVDIGCNVWIGMNVSVVPGVTIGDGAIIGMGTVVSSDVLPLAVVGNAPTRIIKQRDVLHYQSLVETKSYSGMSGYSLE